MIRYIRYETMTGLADRRNAAEGELSEKSALRGLMHELAGGGEVTVVAALQEEVAIQVRVGQNSARITRFIGSPLEMDLLRDVAGYYRWIGDHDAWRVGELERTYECSGADNGSLTPREVAAEIQKSLNGDKARLALVLAFRDVPVNVKECRNTLRLKNWEDLYDALVFNRNNHELSFADALYAVGAK